MPGRSHLVSPFIVADKLIRIFSDVHYGDRSSRVRSIAQLAPLLDGADTVDKIKAMETGPQGPFQSDVPKTPIVIEKVSVLK